MSPPIHAARKPGPVPDRRWTAFMALQGWSAAVAMERLDEGTSSTYMRGTKAAIATPTVTQPKQLEISMASVNAAIFT